MLMLIRHGSIANYYPQICRPIHSDDVRWIYVNLQQLGEKYSANAHTFANVTVKPHVYN